MHFRNFLTSFEPEKLSAKNLAYLACSWYFFALQSRLHSETHLISRIALLSKLLLYLTESACKTNTTLLRFRWGRGRNNSPPVQQQRSTRRAEEEQEKRKNPGKSHEMKSNVNQGGYAPPSFGSGFQPNAPPAEGFGYPPPSGGHNAPYPPAPGHPQPPPPTNYVSSKSVPL